MKLTYVFIAVVLTGGIAAASNFYLANETVEDGENSDGAVAKPRIDSYADDSRLIEIKIGNAVLAAEVAASPQKKAKGLSGRNALGENEGMLFVYDAPGMYGFWMQGMKFDLDFVWIRDDTVVGLTTYVSVPEEGSGNLPAYYPPEPADMVLEINAGSVDKFGIGKGMTTQPIIFQ
ncbi:MAG: hypothetical protein A3J67_00320 [Parcubacteria group bacterium RIFCSPHIGHO2_02_FULL_48_10b]|nr:MAG: hypothetical protein A3J67_00320 [Parcubacteria group bacterium RIFCSPHIGHO2_02_FULL_48_10b]